MRRQRDEELRSGAAGLATQMAALHYQKAERKSRLLETSRATITLQGALIHNLSQRRSLDRTALARSLQDHCLVGVGGVVASQVGLN